MPLQAVSCRRPPSNTQICVRVYLLGPGALGLWASNVPDRFSAQTRRQRPWGCLVCAVLFWKVYLSEARHWNVRDVVRRQLPVRDGRRVLGMMLSYLHPELAARTSR